MNVLLKNELILRDKRWYPVTPGFIYTETNVAIFTINIAFGTEPVQELKNKIDKGFASS